MSNCLAVLGLIFSVITDLTIIISFATPYWLEIGFMSSFLSKIGFTGLSGTSGLWATCNPNDCVWIFENKNYVMLANEDWFKATQGLMCVGLVCAIIALIIGTISLCCRCQDCNPAGLIAGFLLTCFLAIGTAVTLFGIKAYKDLNATVSWDDSHSFYRFGWSYWLAVAAAGSALLTAITYACSGQCKS